MPRVVPSQAVAFIDQVFPWAKTQTQAQHINLTRGQAGQLAGLLDLLDRVPDELITVSGASYGELITSVATIRDRLKLWHAQADPPALELVFVGGLPQFSPVRLIRNALSLCPDQSPAATTAALTFVTDPALRENLRNDISAVDRALSDGEWKAATVLAGSAIEALLLWALQLRPPPEIATAVTALRATGELTHQPDANLERWDLHEFTEVSSGLKIIKPDTRTEIRLAREFRNLIHPGRAQRLSQKCDRGTALSSVAALDHVVRDLS